MKARRPKLLETAATELDLPAEVLGASNLEITGCSRVYLGGHKGIREYGDTEIVVDLRDCAVKISGTGLHLKAMTRDELLLGGALSSIVFLR